jgi:hypothetical protein
VPGFGTDPPLLVGRGDLLDELEEALDAGTGSPWFCHGLVGDRGVGKTVLLNAMQEHARARGWAVVMLQVARGELFMGQLLRQTISEAGSRWTKFNRLAKDLNLEMTIGADLRVAKAELKVSPAGSIPTLSENLQHALVAVGEHAKSNGSGVMITIDEAHSLEDNAERVALGVVLQMVVKRRKLPIAVHFAGLPHMRQMFRASGTFLERLAVDDVDYLSGEAVSLALLKPMADVGVTIDDEALQYLVDSADGYPYLVQLVGYYAWRAMTSTKRITIAGAQKGVRQAEERMDELFETRWEPLSPLEQQYLLAVAQLGGTARTAEVAGALKRTHQQLSSTRDALINHHRLLRAPRNGSVTYAIAAQARWVARRV